MFSRIFLCFSIIFLITKSAFGHVEISGTAPSYANTEIAFCILSDPFTKTEIRIAVIKFNDTGYFNVKLPILETSEIFVNTGIYKGSLFAEPGKKYVISFPEKKDKTKAERLNPFFEPVEFHFPIDNIAPNDLNFNIVAFNNTFFPYLDKFIMSLRSPNKKSVLDSALSILENVVKDSNMFFNYYVHYKIGFLKNLAFQQRSKAISKEYFQKSPILYNNPAYIELFQQVYSRYFYYFGRDIDGKKIYSDVNKDKSYSKLTATLKKDSILFSDSLRELVILKNIHDEFYASNFSRSGLLAILDSLKKESKIEKSREIATFIRAKITRLMPGFSPPNFELTDQSGKQVKLSDFSGSYLYICFCTCSSYSCIKEFDALQKMHDKYKDKKLQIITISNDDDWASMSDFVKKAGFQWTFLFAGNQIELLEKYDIRAYPTYFLIGPDGKLIYSPSISPTEGFELKLFNIMRANKDI